MIACNSGVLFHNRNKRQSGLCFLMLTLLIILLVDEVQAGRQFDVPLRHAPEGEVIYIGVLANRGDSLCLVEWGPMADYLSEHLSSYEVRILPLGFDELLDEISKPDTRMSFVSANPSYYAYMEYYSLARRIATLQIPGDAGPRSSFGGVIFTRADRTDIRDITDLQKIHFAAVNKQSLGGWHAALREMHNAGLKPGKDFRSLVFKGTHDAVVKSVLAGQVDAGTVRSTQLERMAKEGLIDLSDIHVINSQAEHIPNYPYLLSTRLYPEWPFAVISGVDDELSKKVAMLLLTMDENHPAALAMRGAGWTIPEQYISVHDLLRDLLLPPYEDYGITLRKTIIKYWPWLLTTLILLVAAIGFGIFIYFLKRRAQAMSKKLIKSETRFTKLFDNAPVSIMVMDIESSEIVDANKKAIESYGLTTLEELKNADLWADPPYSFNEVILWHSKLLKEGSQRFEWRSRTVQGEYFWEDVLIQVIDFGTAKRVVVISNDISERKKMEEELRKSEEIFRNLSDNLSVGVAMINKNMEVLTVNPQLREWFPDGNYTSCPKCYHAFNNPPTHGLCAGCPIAKTFVDGKTHHYEREAHTNRGKRYFSITSTAIMDTEGEITAAIEMVDDITERKNTESILQQARQQAEEANKAKSDFLANMSHEIRTPLNGIIGFSDLLVKTRLDSTQKLYIENVSMSAQSLLAIINDILDLSKIEADKLELEIIKTDVYDLVEQAIDIIKFHADQKHLELLLNVDPKLPRFAILDPVRLKQILVNLLSNAVKFTEKGEVELRVNFDAVDDKKGRLTFLVRDTGIGINEEHQKKIFDVFMQADTTTTRRYGGSGLGLPISGLLAAKMGSRIEVSSREGEGSQFSFSIETSYETGEKYMPEKLNDIKSVLVVDDNAGSRLILRHTFMHWNIRVDDCDNGVDAIKLLKKRAFDLAIVDYHMTGMNGLDTIRHIREDLMLSPEKLPVFLLHSSADDPVVFKQMKKLGIRYKIIKPVKSKELLQYLMSLKQSPEITEKEKKAENKATGNTIQEEVSPLILLVEDVEMNLLLIRTLIKRKLPGARFLEAADGREALEAYKANHPDLVFMDVQMPVMDGWEATAAIRSEEQKTQRRVPVIALTARALKEEIVKCMEAGMDDFLAKPINEKELEKMLKKYIPNPDNNS
jgi:PAS domain S-box-containing protein